METETLETLTVRYGRRLEALLEALGATGEARGAGEMLDQVKHLLDEEGLNRIRRFLRLRNKVIHNKPRDMPMPTKEALEKAALEAIGVLERALKAQRRKGSAARGRSPVETAPLFRFLRPLVSTINGRYLRPFVTVINGLLGLLLLAPVFVSQGFEAYLFLFFALLFLGGAIRPWVRGGAFLEEIFKIFRYASGLLFLFTVAAIALYVLDPILPWQAQESESRPSPWGFLILLLVAFSALLGWNPELMERGPRAQRPKP